MKKGFATILVAASVFVIAILLLSNNPVENVSYNPNFSELKVRISNYEIIMLEVAQDCNWEKNESDIENCLNGIFPDAEQIFNVPYTTCNLTPFNVIRDQNLATTKINCVTEIDSGKEGYFSNELNKTITIKNYP